MKKYLLLLLSPFVVIAVAVADSKQVWYEYDSQLGADGYDVVAYSASDAAILGQTNIKAEYDGKTWYFSTIENRESFLKTPEKYIPQYGGHCAYAASLNAQAFGDPKVWTIHDDKLYFNYSSPVRARWSVGVSDRVGKGDKYWQVVMKKHNRNIQ